MTIEELTQLVSNIVIMNARKDYLTKIESILLNNEDRYNTIKVLLSYRLKDSLEQVIEIPLEDISTTALLSYITNELLNIKKKIDEITVDVEDMTLPIKSLGKEIKSANGEIIS